VLTGGTATGGIATGGTPSGGTATGGTTGGTPSSGGTAGSAAGGAPLSGGTGPASGGSSGAGTGGTAGGTTVDFFFELPQAVRRGDVTFAATGGDVRVNDSVDILEPAGGYSSVSAVDGGAVARIGVNADVQNVWSQRAVDLANAAKVHGFVLSSAAVTTQPDTVVTGGIQQYESLGQLQHISWSVTFPGGTLPSASLEPGVRGSILPGAYAASDIKAGAHLGLSTGTYTFDALMVQTGAFLDIDNTAGAVFVYVREGFTYRGTVTRAAEKANILFGVAGTNAVPIETPFTGIVVAPWAKITLGTLSGQTHRGSFFAQSVEAHQATNIYHEALEPSEFCPAGGPCTSFCACGPGTAGCTSDDQCDGRPCSINGICGCTPNCAGKTCGGDPSDGCGTQCAGICNDGQSGCATDLQCQAGSFCRTEGSSKVCRPNVCQLQDPHLPGCGVGTADCGSCPICPPKCEGKICGDDGCGGSCGPTPPNATCVGGGLVDNISRDEGHTPGFPAPIGKPYYSDPEAGAIPGSFGVSDRGTADYSISIEVPPGRGGVEPRLTLSYSSTMANGMMGSGWHLRGLSSIERCRKTAAQDGSAQPITLTPDDALCLDGERLYRLTSAELPGMDATTFTRTHYTEIERFQGVMAIGPEYEGTTYVGPKAFKVWTKDGRILTYGVHRWGTQEDGNSVADINGVHRVWNLSAIEDRAGNRMRVSYLKSPASDPTTREVVPASIFYGGQWEDLASPVGLHDREVRFSYTDRPDPAYHRVAGERMTSSLLLNKIETYALGELVNTYSLGYAVQGANQSRLTSVTLCGSYGDAPRCLPSTWFEYIQEELGDSYQVNVSLPEPSTTWSVPPVVLDWNGDGADDFLYWTGKSWLVFHDTSRTGADWTATKVELPYPTWGRPLVVDVNRDGRDDVVMAGWIFTSTEAGFSASDSSLFGEDLKFLQGDLNGDGLQDLVRCETGGEYSGGGFITLHLNTGYAFRTWGDEPPPPRIRMDAPYDCNKLLLIDRDGDGDDDLIEFTKNAYPKALADIGYADGPRWVDAGFEAPISDDDALLCQTFGICGDYYLVFEGGRRPSTFKVLDVNGDGLKDILVSNETSQLAVWLSTGTGFAPQFVGSLGTWGLTDASILNSFVSDYDQDGRDDLVVAGGKGVLRGQADGTFEWVAHSSPSEMTFPADVNGDGAHEWLGLPDIGEGLSSQSVRVTTTSSKRGLMSAIEDGVGHRITIGYGSRTTHSDLGQVYTYDPNRTLRQTGTIRLRRVAPLVSWSQDLQVWRDSSRVIQYSKLGPRYFYSYEGAEVGIGGRG
jgi:hypothetical protein